MTARTGTLASARSSPRRGSQLRSFVLLVVSSLAAPTAIAAQSAEKANAASLLKQAKSAQAAGRLSDAIRLADAILVTSPSNREAASVKISASMAAGDRAGAVQGYERFLTASRQTADGQLLADIARGDLRTLASSEQNEQLAAMALETLARHGDDVARQTLLRSLTATATQKAQAPGGEASTAALARLGNPQALARIRVLVQSGQVAARPTAIDILKASGARESGDVLLAALKDPNPLVQAAAADALGTLDIRAAIPALKQALVSPVFLVKVSAGVALKRLGDASADQAIALWLKSDLADVRLMAARAYEGGQLPPEVTAAVQPLLDDPNGLTRFRAAEVLLGAQHPRARETLVRGVEDPNPVVRAEATRIVASKLSGETPLLARMLEDNNPWVRLHAAGAIVANAHRIEDLGMRDQD
jgi:HEAT repeat protein